jgi:hypothetical protein
LSRHSQSDSNVTGGAATAVLQRDATAAIVKILARVIAPRYITLSLPCGEKGDRIRRVKYLKITLATLAALCASLAVADDFKTIDGKEYTNAKVSRVEPDGIVLITKSGISKVYFVELPKEIQERFHYDAQQGAQFTAQTLEENRLIRQQQAEEEQKRVEQKAAERQMQRRQQETEMQQQERQAEIQRRQEAAEQRRQPATQQIDKSAPSVSKEGVREHTYELLQDYTINMGGWSKRVRRGERYHGRILVDHAEIDINGISYTVPSGVLSSPKD